MDRKLPDFVVIGALRAGTTTLYNFTRQLPGICLTTFKEPDYFIEEFNWPKGGDWYESLFKCPEKICGDFSPNYSSADKFKGVPERIHQANPDAKLIYTVRDPVARAVSHYNLNWLAKRVSVSPQELMTTDSGRHIVDGSRYMRQLEPFLEVFSPEQIMVVDFKDLVGEPHATLRRICNFIDYDVDEETLMAVEPQHRNSSQQLAALPAWWRRFNRWSWAGDSKVIRSIRGAIPETITRPVKNAVAAVSSTEAQAPPAFSDPAKSALKAALKPDAMAFRKFTKNRFEDWSV